MDLDFNNYYLNSNNEKNKNVKFELLKNEIFCLRETIKTKLFQENYNNNENYNENNKNKNSSKYRLTILLSEIDKFAVKKNNK